MNWRTGGRGIPVTSLAEALRLDAPLLSERLCILTSTLNLVGTLLWSFLAVNCCIWHQASSRFLFFRRLR
jgi:hypothetical protein